MRSEQLQNDAESPDLFDTDDDDIPPLPPPAPPLSSLPHFRLSTTTAKPTTPTTPSSPAGIPQGFVLAAGDVPPTPRSHTSILNPVTPFTGNGCLTNDGEVPMDLALSVRRSSCSRKNFGVNLCRHLFPPDVRSSSNVSGIGKKQLDPLRIAAIRRAAFSLWPLTPGQEEKKEWRTVVVAIDEANRRLNRK